MRSESGSLALGLPPSAHLAWHERHLVGQLGRLRRGTLRVGLRGLQPFLIQGGERGPAAEIDIRRPAGLFRRLVWRGDVGFAESYIAGDWATTDLPRLLEVLALNLDVYADADRRHPLAQALVGLRHWFNRNTRRGSRHNISAHYDLGNDFYAQWLDLTIPKAM